ncbi:hypothetical protein SCHPADRAFT_927245 [Schizopora paradoxa]|uniref:Uncharacterized protein n=1 Tax=Schizopora paradoxa TaxID=27342 RepID=A0A0H2S0L2_9AGAM|nr:hypothetical protein SCHPADRAFT_927245 [Schizopora paradoxa]
MSAPFAPFNCEVPHREHVQKSHQGRIAAVDSNCFVRELQIRRRMGSLIETIGSIWSPFGRPSCKVWGGLEDFDKFTSQSKDNASSSCLFAWKKFESPLGTPRFFNFSSKLVLQTQEDRKTFLCVNIRYNCTSTAIMKPRVGLKPDDSQLQEVVDETRYEKN